MEFFDLISYKRLKELDPLLFAQVKDVYDAVKETINAIAGCFNNFTMHDIGHSVRVANYMEQLAFGIDENDAKKKIDSFNAGELAILLLSALLHDIGMFIRETDRKEIEEGNIKYNDNLTFEGVLKVKNGDKAEAVKEIIRLTHAKRIFEFLDCPFGTSKTISDILQIDSKYPYAVDIGNICQAHGEDYDFIKNNLRNSTTKGNYEFNSQYMAVLLRIADCLDLDRQRTPMLWFATMGIEGFSKEEWEKHFQISNERKLKPYYDGKMQIYFDGISSNAKIHRKYLKYIDNLRDELENADLLLNNKDTDIKYHLNITTKIEDMVETKGFQYSDLRLNLDYAAITELLMGKNIYGDSKLGLRELIQNSIDACRLMKEVSDKSEDDINPYIAVKISKSQNHVIIKDTGIGMTLDVIKNHFLNIGKSYYKSNEYLFNNFDYKPIGQFGIGFLACFLLSDNVVVKTKHYKSSEICQIELEKNSEYVVTNTEASTNFNGTEIQLDYDKFFNTFKSFDDLKDFISTFFYTEIPIYLIDSDSKLKIEIKNKDETNIDVFLTKTNKQPIIIDCTSYSECLRGKILLIKERRAFSQEIEELGSNAYLYDENKNIFVKVSKLEEGYYNRITYAEIDNNLYESISSSRKEIDNKAKAIIAAAKENNSQVYLFIKFGTKFPFAGYIMHDNNVGDLKKILTDSGLHFYHELFIHGSHPIFVSGNKILHLYYCSLDNRKMYSYRYYLDDKENVPSSLYYKGIFISCFRPVQTLIPTPFQVFGYINYVGDNLKLDVSRNEIIDGYKHLNTEFQNVLLKYKLSSEKENPISSIINKMLCINQTNHI